MERMVLLLVDEKVIYWGVEREFLKAALSVIWWAFVKVVTKDSCSVAWKVVLLEGY